MNITHTFDKAPERSALYIAPAWARENVNAPRKEEETTVTGLAAEVHISKAAQRLHELERDPVTRMNQTDFMTSSETELAKLEHQEAERQENKKKAEELQKKIDTDITLSSEDKDRLQKDADDYREKSMNTDDKLYALYDKRDALQERYEASKDTMLEGEQGGFEEQLTEVDWNIGHALDRVGAEGALKASLRLGVDRERAKMKQLDTVAQLQGVKIDKRSAEAAMEGRTPEQIAADAKDVTGHTPTSQDVVQKAVEEGKELSEKTAENGGYIAAPAAKAEETDSDKEINKAGGAQRAEDIGASAQQLTTKAGESIAANDTKEGTDALQQRVAELTAYVTSEKLPTK